MRQGTTRVRAFGFGAALVVITLGTAAPAAASTRHTDRTAAVASAGPSATNFQQVTADPPIAVPATASCTEQVMVHDFYQSYYAPGTGTLTSPAACPGPWSKVVLTFAASVGGVQFDRLADVYVGAVNVFSTSTSEPCCTPGATTSWSWQKDVTEYLPAVTAAQTVTVFLNNVNDATYTGVYHVTVSFTFYETGAGAPQGAHPDVVLPVDNFANSGGDGFFTLSAAGQRGTAAVAFPSNLVRLDAELFAQGHGACEEFWWGDPDNCGVATPYREVDVFIDGQIAGAAPVYPTTFTGADGPGLWEPIPSPRAWNLRPYVVDLTPFVGGLVDGKSHSIAIGVSDVVYGSGDYWLVGANLLGWVDSAATQSTGALTAVNAPVAPSETNTPDPSGSGLGDLFSAQHALSWTGHVQGSGGPVTTTVQTHISINTSEAGISTDSAWDWRNDVTTAGITTSSDSTYSIVNSSLGHFQFGDANTTTIAGAASSSFSEVMTTAAVGLALNGVECESYAASYPDRTSYDHLLTAAAGNVVTDTQTGTCPSIAPAPGTAAPDIPLVPLIPLVAATAAAGVIWRRRVA